MPKRWFYKDHLAAFVIVSLVIALVHATIFHGSAGSVCIGLIGFHLVAGALSYPWDSRHNGNKSIENDAWYKQLLMEEAINYQIKAHNILFPLPGEFVSPQRLISELKVFLIACQVSCSEALLSEIATNATENARRIQDRHSDELAHFEHNLCVPSDLAEHIQGVHILSVAVGRVCDFPKEMTALDIAQNVPIQLREFAVRITPELTHMLRCIQAHPSRAEASVYLKEGLIPLDDDHLFQYLQTVRAKMIQDTARNPTYLTRDQELFPWQIIFAPKP